LAPWDCQTEFSEVQGAIRFLARGWPQNLVVLQPELVVAVHHEDAGKHQNYRQERDYHKLETVDVLQDFFFDHCTDHFLSHIIPDKSHERPGE